MNSYPPASYLLFDRLAAPGKPPMLFRLIYDPLLAHASYLVACQKTGEAIIIDPSRDIDRYFRVAEQEKVRITAAAETHIHADFLSGCREFAHRGVQVHLSDMAVEGGGPDWTYRWPSSDAGSVSERTRSPATGQPATDFRPPRLLKHNDIIKVGHIDLRVIHTPGHTPEHICFEVTDRGSGATESMGIFTGDFVFVGDLGRPDLLESAAGVAGAADASARLLLESARRFKTYPEYLQVWPAHGAGSACGKALGAVPQSTVGYELRHNQALISTGSADKFISEMLSGQPEPPLYFARMKRDNRDGPPLLGEFPSPETFTVEDIRRLDPGVVVIDTRTWAEFRSGHFPGSIYAPANTNFSAVAGSYVNPEDRIILVGGELSMDLIRCLIRIGLDRVEGLIFPQVLHQYAGSGGTLATTEEIDIPEFQRRIAAGAVNILDVRRAEEWQAGHLKDSTNIAHTRLASRLAEVPKDKPLAIHCLGGGRSSYAAAFLERHGYRVANVAGGFGAWQRAGGTVVKSLTE
jgi:hydroxyacylglutathione hydrolase